MPAVDRIRSAEAILEGICAGSVRHPPADGREVPRGEPSLAGAGWSGEVGGAAHDVQITQVDEGLVGRGREDIAAVVVVVLDGVDAGDRGLTGPRHSRLSLK